MDCHTPEQRHYNMSQIHGKDTKPEVLVRKYLFSRGLRYRKNDRRLPGHPDIVLPKYKTVIFVNGCFWHGHNGCTHFVLPKSNTEYWTRKIAGNISRDCKEHAKLTELGWDVIVVWECQLKAKNRNETLLGLLQNIVNSALC